MPQIRAARAGRSLVNSPMVLCKTTVVNHFEENVAETVGLNIIHSLSSIQRTGSYHNPLIK